MPDDALSHLLAPTRRAVLGLAALGGLAACDPLGNVLPAVSLPGVEGLTLHGWPVPGIAGDQFRRRVSVLNVWASWCPYCRSEHGELMKLSNDRRFALVGLVFQDTAEKARAYLKAAGNPFSALAVDGNGVFTRVLGQRGVPATYVIDREARVTLRLRGAISPERVTAELMPAVETALAG
jgi:cytochrome c biogenesis protein CcmG/thiol:disulfide interchange protein DsbE